MPSILVTPLVLLLALWGAPQHPNGGAEPTAGSHCHGRATRCLFGLARGCQVTCSAPAVAHCQHASCTFGFPVAARCLCRDC